MSLLEISLLSMLTIVSLWLAYLNYKILKVSKDILNITYNLNKEPSKICYLTERMVENTSMPDEWRVPPAS